MIFLSVGFAVLGLLAWAGAAINYRAAVRLTSELRDLLRHASESRAHLDAQIRELSGLRARAAAADAAARADADRRLAAWDIDGAWERWKGARP